MKEPKFAWTDDDIVKVYNPSVTIYVDMWRRKFTDNHDSRSIQILNEDTFRVFKQQKRQHIKIAYRLIYF